MNERRFHNGREVAPVPLLTLFAASNELPEDDELLALHDRFLLRFVVDYIGEDFRFLKLLQAQPPADAHDARRSTSSSTARAEAAALTVPGDVLRAVTDLRRELGRAQRGRVRSPLGAVDRRAARARLARGPRRGRRRRRRLPGARPVARPGRAQAVRDAIRELLHGYEDEVRVLLYQSRELRDYALRDVGDAASCASAPRSRHTPSCAPSSARSTTILTPARDGGRPTDGVEALRAGDRADPAGDAGAALMATRGRRTALPRGRSSSRRASTAGSRATPTTAARSPRWWPTRRRSPTSLETRRRARAALRARCSRTSSACCSSSSRAGARPTRSRPRRRSTATLLAALRDHPLLEHLRARDASSTR